MTMMTTTEKRELYEKLSNLFNFKKGDRVKVLFKVPHRTFGWDNRWILSMDNQVGDIFTVKDSGRAGVHFEEISFGYPCFCLKLVEEEEEQPTITIKGKEFSEDTIAAALKEYTGRL